MGTASAIQILEGELVQLYARALVAIARADGQIGFEEGLRLQERLRARGGEAIPLDDLLLAEPLDPGQLAAAIGRGSGPFRGGSVHPGELAKVIVVDAIAVVLAKGYVAEGEAQALIRFATALGCTLDEVRRMSAHLSPWLGRIG